MTVSRVITGVWLAVAVLFTFVPATRKFLSPEVILLFAAVNVLELTVRSVKRHRTRPANYPKE